MKETIKDLNSYSDSSNEEDDLLAQKKAEAKELGIVVKGKQTVESIQKKIDEFKDGE